MNDVMGRFDSKTQQFREYHLLPGTNPSSLLEFRSGKSGSGSYRVWDAIRRLYRSSLRSHLTDQYTTWSEGDILEYPMSGTKAPPSRTLREEFGSPYQRLGHQYIPQGSKIGRLNISSTDIRLVDIPTENGGPYDIAVNSKEVPFFTERNSPRLGTVDPTTMRVTEYVLPNPDSGPRGIAVTSDDVIWYTDYLRGYLGRFDPKTGEFKEWPSPSGPRSLPYGITAVGNIVWYAEAGTKPNMLVRFDPKTEKFQSWPVKDGGGIRRMYADKDGSLWFTRPLTNGIAHVTIKEQ